MWHENTFCVRWFWLKGAPEDDATSIHLYDADTGRIQEYNCPKPVTIRCQSLCVPVAATLAEFQIRHKIKHGKGGMIYSKVSWVLWHLLSSQPWSDRWGVWDVLSLANWCLHWHEKIHLLKCIFPRFLFMVLEIHFRALDAESCLECNNCSLTHLLVHHLRHTKR